MKNVLLSFSAIKEFNKSPLHFLTYKAKKKTETPAMRFGKAVHKLVLEFDQFANEYAVAPDCDRRTTVGKNIWNEFTESAGDKTVLTQSEMVSILDIKHAIDQHPAANEIVKYCTARELHIETEIFGHKFHGFVDGFGPGLVFDLKTTMDASEYKFTRTIENDLYFVQAAIYCHALGVDEFRFVAVESTAPHMVGVYRLESEWLNLGMKKLELILEKFDQWDGTAEHYNSNRIVTPRVNPFLI
jgi:exodeoxyribonuclease VIII